MGKQSPPDALTLDAIVAAEAAGLPHRARRLRLILDGASSIDRARAELEEFNADYDAGRFFGQMIDGTFVADQAAHHRLIALAEDRLEDLESEETQRRGFRDFAMGEPRG